jgi:hypothetical protein
MSNLRRTSVVKAGLLLICCSTAIQGFRQMVAKVSDRTPNQIFPMAILTPPSLFHGV